MPTAYKVLGQSYPSAASNTDVYTVPASNSAVVSTININNLSSDLDTVSVAVRPAGETIANKHYIINNLSIGGRSVATFTIGVTLATTDVITVYSLGGTSAFNVFGSEIS